jgi:predicted nuclease with RNAse H fold
MITAGIDVGSRRKGFHLVILDEHRMVAQLAGASVSEVIAEITRHKAKVVAVDSPSQWALTGGSRAAERLLQRQGIRCFYTPARDRPKVNEQGFYGWVFHGLELWEALRKEGYSDYIGTSTGKLVIETFPHGIACRLTGQPLSAKDKRRDRGALVSKLGYDLGSKPSIDLLDTTLCAHTARFLKQAEAFGDTEEGHILLPGKNSCQKIQLTDKQ